MNEHEHQESIRANRHWAAEEGSVLRGESSDFEESRQGLHPYCEGGTAMGLAFLALFGIVLSHVLKSMFN